MALLERDKYKKEEDYFTGEALMEIKMDFANIP